MKFRTGARASAAMIMAATALLAGAVEHNSGRAVYLVALTDPPLVAQAAARAHSPGLNAQQEQRAVRQEMGSAASQDYLQRLDRARANVVGMAQKQLGRALAPQQVYRYASNGMALELDADEAALIAALPGVAAVRRERVLHVSTDAGPQWIGANQLWSGAVNGVATK